MTSALHFPSLHLDGKRIIANAAVLSLHIIALALLMAPVRWQPPPTRASTPSEPTVIVPVLLPVTPKPPPAAPRLLPQPRTPVRSTVAPLPQALPEAPVLPDSAAIDSLLDNLGEPGDEAITADSGGTDAGSGLSTLNYAEAPPPRYPRPALHAGLEGEVLLRVLVDPRGRVLQVEIERSSGHRQLDLAALRQVQTRWRFHPALRDGQPISAWGLVPIVFSLPR